MKLNIYRDISFSIVVSPYTSLSGNEHFRMSKFLYSNWFKNGTPLVRLSGPILLKNA